MAPQILHVSVRRYRYQECAQALPRHEPSSPAAHQALAVGGALDADGCGHSPFDDGAHRPGPERVNTANTTVLVEGRVC